MKRLVLTVVALTLITSAFAVEAWRNGERQPLWPEGKIPDFQAHQCRMPYLEWFEKPANPNGGCMILVPGGDYESCDDLANVKTWKETFSALGYQTVGLVYRTPRPKGIDYYKTAWEDGQRAVRVVRSQAKARGYDPEKIGAIGMSAGGHLVTLLGTSSLTPTYGKVDALDDLPCHLNWAIANAPAYNALGSAHGGANSTYGITCEAKISPHFAFDAKTCPMSFHHGGADDYPANGSVLCYRELRRRKVPAELHLYADTGHVACGLDRAIEFMNQMEFTKKHGSEVQLDHRFMPGDTIRTEKEMLWPEGKMPGVSTNQTYDPYLVWFVPEKLKTKAIQVIVPGGGYYFCNFNGEGTPVAHYLNGKGMTTVVVMYRCPRPLKGPKHLSAWQDAQRAIRMVRHEAPARGLDPNRIGIMGFSAGGHLTLMTATNAKTPAYEPVDEIDKLSCKVQWACPVYPAYVVTDGANGINTDGGNRDEDTLVSELSFDADTPPMCFVHGDGDPIAAMASVKSWEKLRRKGIQCDLHTLAKRGHCFQIHASPGTGSYTWMDRLWDFLDRKKLVRDDEATGLNGISFDVPKTCPCEALSKDGLKAMWIEGEPCKGKPTWAFAYLALPAGATVSNRVPGIVLAHGGGGTAYPTWAQTWAKHGYAAIVVDTCGNLPIKRPNGAWHDWIGSGVGGPGGWGRMELGLEPASDQWPYQAVGALVRAHSYLRSLPQVDAEKTGLTGISWGGYLTMLTAGFDTRFKFAMPVYACAFFKEMERVGGLNSASRPLLPPETVARWDSLFEPKHYVPRMKMPVFWFASSNDFAFPFDILQDTVRLLPEAPGLAIRVNMVHSHGPHGENMPELFRFADQVVRGAPPLPTVGEPKVEKNVFTVTADAKGNAFRRVELNWCADDPPAKTSAWNVVRHPVPADGVFRAPVPAAAKRVYANFVLEGATGETVYPEAVVSSRAIACPGADGYVSLGRERKASDSE